MKSDIVTLMHVKLIKVTSDFNLRIMKKLARWLCHTEKSKTKNIDVAPGVPGVSKYPEEPP